MLEPPQWQVKPQFDLPDWFIQAVHQNAPEAVGDYAAQILWQRGIRDPAQLAGFINPNTYQPSNPFDFGPEMHRAIARLQQAYQQAEPVAIWGDFDADGITATAVLWDGLGQFFQPQQLTYYIPNRLADSHGLSTAGIDRLAAQGYSLIVTCDTGSTNLKEIDYALGLGIDIIVTDHHTLPADRPPVTAIINPRSLPADHPLAHLSGVAVAYKLVEALYQTLPTVPTHPLEDLLDLVAIGLIADLVELTGDCRYLAQRGIEQLQQHQKQLQPRRPGIARLLELCKKSGDRPTDISFGLGPRINAISRIYGDARFCVELLTSRDPARCHQLADETELANTRRKALQKEVARQVSAKLGELDLSTTSVIVLADPQWSVGVLGLVAGQIAQEYNRPTILLSTATHPPNAATPDEPLLARGSARSVNQIDLYQLIKPHEAILRSFGGHPFAAGLSLPVENIPLFAAAINRQLREQQAALLPVTTSIQADLVVTVEHLGKELFRTLKLLEPYGMGNPVPKLLVQNCWFEDVHHRNLKDRRGGKVSFIKTDFKIWDGSVSEGFPGVWWGHYKDDVPRGRCDAIVELDFNTYQTYHVRLIAVSAHEESQRVAASSVDWIVDWRNVDPIPVVAEDAVLQVTQCPSSWEELQIWFRRAIREQTKLAIAYSLPKMSSPTQVWQRLVGIAKYLSRTGQPATRLQFHDALDIGDRPLAVGMRCLKQFGFELTASEDGIQVRWHGSTQPNLSEPEMSQAIAQFLGAVQEEQFRYEYFCKVPLSTIQAVASYAAQLHHLPDDQSTKCA
ncbi:single-stranded-DNA-specific exonuclease RecJ [Oculatella sp. LEGE 06141]|uniref:single-stranded-DNA-specific exonuclease RecJ n=1 Tax=Oculatella sp. LEGE 06141 TaxID=1828648 RepID=UPI0018823ED1|nr:single-stranded-DNA-specific exonuclease RecJ [Oculatella sp. LEGE 06141]MBE9178905.1 single-stranded-DNA-specific exonuclease RecJ [Oculatella sp. LEGE 06141]